jgi:DMSO/TMAO reductase YedYZ heme-binding membrane subunit
MTGSGMLLAGPAKHVIIVTSTTPLWYATRASGLTAMVLLSASMVLGVLTSVRYQRPGWPRFLTVGLHRSVSLMALAFTAIHIATSLADQFVPIGVQNVVIPFVTPYRTLWVGLGTIAFDLMLALIITSLLRAKMSLLRWRLVHFTAYLCWPVAILHGLGTGSDTQVRWVLLLTLACVAGVTAAVCWRLSYGWPSHRAARVAGAVVVVLALVAGGTWLSRGPLQPGWARKAGSPTLVKPASAGSAQQAGQA